MIRIFFLHTVLSCGKLSPGLPRTMSPAPSPHPSSLPQSRSHRSRSPWLF